jgi:bifunctional UDP-N-acetylglucosamine pyrophosphorylase/glucosamine-1-phosphate N-acetyltransferase
MAAPTAALKRWLAALDNDNSQGEFYLTDVVALAVADDVAVVTVKAASETEVLGVNSPVQLADLERRVQRKQAEALMEAGVRLADPARVDLRGELQCGTDVEIDVNCVFEGAVLLGDGVRIGANCVIRNAIIAANAVIHPFTHIDGEALGVRVGAGSSIGPFARLRPGAVLGEEVHIGNFVEVKNSTLAKGAKANHLAYLGDGAITANYDGANKHRTVIGNDVHVGSNCVLIAPITLGDGATIGGGSTLSKDAPAGQLTVARGKQLSLAGWKRPAKKR